MAVSAPSGVESGHAAPLTRIRWGVVVFPGTNCELETVHVLRDVLGQDADLVWHEETDLSAFDALVLPGGFAHGDYLRAGAVARFSPVMEAVRAFAESGKPVLGICNGFQVLLEARLLPGAMLRNRSQRFASRWIHVRVEATRSPFLSGAQVGQVLHLPIAHGEGNYFADSAELKALRGGDQIALRYCDADGTVTPGANPNGSTDNIAGVCSARGNVLALMPHPERAAEAVLGCDDGRLLFAGAVAAATGRAAG